MYITKILKYWLLNVDTNTEQQDSSNDSDISLTVDKTQKAD